MKKELHHSPEKKYSNEIKHLVNQYIKVYPQEKARLSQLATFLDENLNLTDRKNFKGHLTASAIVVNPEGRVLLLHHKNLNRWLQPGGHIDGLETPLAAVEREIREETSISEVQLHPQFSLNQMPFDIDTHSIPSNPSKDEEQHFHHDFRYLLITDNDKIIIDESEVIECSWFDIEKAKSEMPGFPWHKIVHCLTNITK